MMRLFDAHAHLQLPAFDADREEVLARMRERDISALMPGVDFATSKAALELAKQHDFLFAAVGLHPNDNREEEFDVAAFAALTADPKVIAIGECGLDYYRLKRDNKESDSLLRAKDGSMNSDSYYRNVPSPEERERQTARFEKHLDLALKLDKPLIIHCRPTQGTQNAHEEMLALLAQRPEARAVIHFFTSTAEIAERYLALGCYLSFPGPITYTGMYDESIRATPLERILVETDSPFAAPVPHRGQRNEPAYVEGVAKKVAAVKGVLPEELSAQVVRNARTAFGL